MTERDEEEKLRQKKYNKIYAKLNGKKIGLFGSYGWGDGEWMRNWKDDCESAGAVFAHDYVICNEAPDDDASKQCEELGAALA